MAQPLIDYSRFDFDRPMFDQEAVRAINPQRFEMEQLTAVVHVDTDAQLAVGYKEVTDHEFWIRGHMPDYALMPGVILCESAAQLGGFYARKYKVLGGDYLGFGGINEVRFRAPVYPNCRLILVLQITKVRPKRLVEYDFQGFVNDKMVFNGNMIGVPIERDTVGKDPS